jgi:glycosyltransferase involved in cell wall biosynthesis
MRVLLLNQFFWPDTAPTGQLLTDLARYLAEQGHEVTAICDASNYSEDDTTPEPPVRIIAVRGLRFGRGKLDRLLSYLIFYAKVAWKAGRLPGPDVVVTLTTPPLLSLIGTAMKLVRGCNHYVWEMDLYPEVAVDLGVLRPRSLLTRVVAFFAAYYRRKADGIVALGECMKQRLLLSGVEGSKVHVAENWADSRFIYPLWRKTEHQVIVLYSGNLGLAHDVDTIAESMAALRREPRIQFVFAGGGAQRERLKGLCRERAVNASFVPLQPKVQLAASFGLADVGLVTQHRNCFGSVVPSKVYGLMAAAKPFIYVGPRGTTPHRLIEQFGCGWQIDCGDSAALTDLLLRLQRRPVEIEAAGHRAHEAFQRNYNIGHGVARIGAILGVSAVAVPAIESRST